MAKDSFQKDRLTAAVQKAGITGQPEVQFYPVHNLFAPNIEEIKKAGASSMPVTA